METHHSAGEIKNDEKNSLDVAVERYQYTNTIIGYALDAEPESLDIPVGHRSFKKAYILRVVHNEVSLPIQSRPTDKPSTPVS